jgi:predicted MFS family arabinose efflux permease
MVCHGICGAIASYIFGALVKYIGRVGCFIIAAAFNYVSIMLMYFWNPLEEQMYILFIIAGLWGTASAAWQSQVIGIISFI